MLELLYCEVYIASFCYNADDILRFRMCHSTIPPLEILGLAGLGQEYSHAYFDAVHLEQRTDPLSLVV